jgi:putative ribosome biogenesis GTPase RsgA
MSHILQHLDSIQRGESSPKNIYLTWVGRGAEERAVVNLLRKRATSHTPDKSDNPLITLPGSPGIGKSTFLNNFPSSEQYMEYVK